MSGVASRKDSEEARGVWNEATVKRRRVALGFLGYGSMFQRAYAPRGWGKLPRSVRADLVRNAMLWVPDLVDMGVRGE